MADVPIDLILTLATTVVKMAMNVKDNKERCQRVAKRVTSLQELVLKLKERDPRQISEVVRNALNELSATLVNARNMMQKFQQANIVKSFIFNSAHEDKFLKINERLDDTFQVLSGAMQIEQGDKLNQVLEAVTSKKNEITQPRQPFPLGFSNMCIPSPVPAQSLPPTSSPNAPKIVPAITVTRAPNPPYPPAQRPAYNPNNLSVPTIHAAVPCAMPPRVVTVPPPASVRPVMTVQNVYGTLPPRPTVPNVIVRTVPPVVYAQAMPPQQVRVTVNQPRPVMPNPGVVTVVMTRHF